MTYKISYLNKAIIFLTLLAACALQVQGDFFDTDTYAGIRLNLTDFILPIAGVLILFSLNRNQSEWPIYKIPNTYIWLSAMTVLFLVSLYVGRIHQHGVVSAWGLHNKVFGWFALMAYFLWGAWFTYNGKSIKIYKFFRNFSIFALVTCIIGSVVITLQDFHVIDGIIAYPYKGMMANRNALGFTILCVTILIFFYGQTSKPLLSPWMEKIFWSFLPIIHVQIGSRSCWILFILQIAAFIFINRNYVLKSIAPFLALGAAIVLFFTAVHSNSDFVFKQHQDVQFVQLPGLLQVFNGQEPSNPAAYKFADYQSDMLRLKVNGLALELWAQSPIFGVGLGTVQYSEPAKFGKFLDVIDSTPIWLLTETGLIGAMIFASFFWLIVFYLSRELRSPHKYIQTINSISLGVLLIFAIMSVMHELMYTRFLWFFLGIAITVPAASLRMHQAMLDQPVDPKLPGL